jgi:hypothetical protein
MTLGVVLSMGRMKIGIAVAGVIVMLLGAAAVLATQSGGDSKHVSSVANQATGATVNGGVTTVVPSVPATQPAQAAKTATTPNAPSAPPTTAGKGSTSAPVTVPTQPTAQDIQRVIAGITAEVLAPANASASTKPLTKEEVEAKVREQLKQLGINY